MSCPHLHVYQLSTITARTDWQWDDEKLAYNTETAICDKVLWEETDGWECADCGVTLRLDDTGDGVVPEEEDG